MRTEEFDIERVREVFGKLAKNIDWENQRGCMPYDWNTYGHPFMAELLDLLKIDWDGSIKSKDKRGSWRVMKNKPSKSGNTEKWI